MPGKSEISSSLGNAETTVDNNIATKVAAKIVNLSIIGSPLSPNSTTTKKIQRVVEWSDQRRLRGSLI
jgi:hypothetical protein